MCVVLFPLSAKDTSLPDEPLVTQTYSVKDAGFPGRSLHSSSPEA